MAAMQGAAKRRDSQMDIRERVEKVLGIVGMQGSQNKFPHELSDGEVRRVELARAIINSPPILGLDEITSNLDEDNIWDIFHIYWNFFCFIIGIFDVCLCIGRRAHPVGQNNGYEVFHRWPDAFSYHAQWSRRHIHPDT